MNSWWEVLGIPRKSDRAAIRRAYAQKLRVAHPEDDPQGFMALREAYEAALRWIEYDDDWDEEQASDEAAEEAVLVVEAAGAQAGPPPLAFDAFPAEPEADPFAEARAADHDELRRRTAALDAALRGPWQGDADALTVQLDAILAAPALIEIAVRDSIEHWLADLLAETVPRSDAVLRQAIDAFGWEKEGNHPPAAWRVLARIDEWRVIQTLQDGDHVLSRGWQALRDAEARGWRQRIGALRPGIAARVRHLLELADYQMPGLAHSFDPAAAAWWRDHLAKPRLGVLDLILLLAGTSLAALLAGLGNSRTVGWGGAAALALGIAVPMIRIRLIAPWRDRRELAGRAVGWPIDLWLALWLAAAMALILMPAGTRMAAIVVSLAVAAILWMAMVRPRAQRVDSPVGRILALLAPVLVSAPALLVLSPGEQLALGVFAAASVTIDAVARDTIVAFMWRITRRPVLLALSIVAALLGAAMVRFQLPAPPLPLIPLGAVAITGVVLLAALHDTHDGSRAAVIAPWVRWGLWVVLVGAAILSHPRGEQVREIPTDPMAQLEQREPGFAALKTGNPGLHSAVALLRQLQADRTRSAVETGDQIDRLVNEAYRERLPRVPGALLAAEMDIRLATLREYRSRDVRACASGESAGKPPELSESLRKRHYRHALAVAGSWPANAADLAQGREIPAGELLRIAANGDVAKAERLAAAMGGSDLNARCDARIAFLEALVAQDDADIAKTMRPALTARADPDSTKK